MLDFGAWLMPFATTALAGIIDVQHNVLVHPFCSLGKCELHDVLEGRRKEQSSPSEAPQPESLFVSLSWGKAKHVKF